VNGIGGVWWVAIPPLLLYPVHEVHFRQPPEDALTVGDCGSCSDVAWEVATVELALQRCYTRVAGTCRSVSNGANP
jgi:hypothetical protein